MGCTLNRTHPEPYETLKFVILKALPLKSIMGFLAFKHGNVKLTDMWAFSPDFSGLWPPHYLSRMR